MYYEKEKEKKLRFKQKFFSKVILFFWNFRCTEESNCANNKKSNYFISSSFDACPKMNNIQPNVAARQDSKQVNSLLY